MKKLGTFVVFLLALITTNSYAEKRDYHFIKQAAENWALAMASGDVDDIMYYYDNQAVMGTCKHFLNTNGKIRNYYRELVKRGTMEVQFNDKDIRISDSGAAATNSGIYALTYVENGQTIHVPVQFTFSYAKHPNSGKWLIIAHYSSFMPAIS